MREKEERPKAATIPTGSADLGPAMTRGHNSRDREALSATERAFIRQQAAQRPQEKDGVGERSSYSE